MTIRGNQPDIIIMDDLDQEPMTDVQRALMKQYVEEFQGQGININTLSSMDQEAFKNDPEAFMGWLDTVMVGGPQFLLDSLPMAIEARPLAQIPEWEFHPMRDTKWVKSRSHSYGVTYYAQEQARKRKRLDKRATTKANRKRARNSK